MVDLLEDSWPAAGPRAYLGLWAAEADVVAGKEAPPGDAPMPPALWGRVYVRNRGSSQAVQMLLVKRFAGTEWVAVDTRRRLQVVNLAERSKVATRLWDGAVAGDVRGLTASEKQSVLDAADEMFRRKDHSGRVAAADGGSGRRRGARMKATERALSSVAAVAAGAWSRRTYGGAGATAFIFWRISILLDLWGWIRYAHEWMSGVAETVEDIRDALDTTIEMHESGRLEWLYIASGLLVLLTFSCCCSPIGRLSLSGAASTSPPPSEASDDTIRDGG